MIRIRKIGVCDSRGAGLLLAELTIETRKEPDCEEKKSPGGKILTALALLTGTDVIARIAGNTASTASGSCRRIGDQFKSLARPATLLSDSDFFPNQLLDYLARFLFPN